MSITREFIISTLKGKGIKFFTISDICKFFKINNNYASQIVYQLKQDEKVEEIEKGKYTISDGDEYPFLIAYKTVHPSYISFKTALNVYEIRDDEGDDIYIATPKRKRPLDFKNYNFKYITLKPYKFFGFCTTKIRGNEIIIAELEKAIIDSLEEMEYGPDIEKFRDILKNSIQMISTKKLVEYACRCRDKSLLARLGYLLETIDVNVKISDKYLPKDYIKLNPTGDRRGKWISKWNIIDNL